jgi:hypothetical protein
MFVNVENINKIVTLVPGEALRSNDDDESDDILMYVLPPMFTLLIVATVAGTVWFTFVRKKQKKRLGMAMTSSKTFRHKPILQVKKL